MSDASPQPPQSAHPPPLRDVLLRQRDALRATWPRSTGVDEAAREGLLRVVEAVLHGRPDFTPGAWGRAQRQAGTSPAEVGACLASLRRALLGAHRAQAGAVSVAEVLALDEALDAEARGAAEEVAGAAAAPAVDADLARVEAVLEGISVGVFIVPAPGTHVRANTAGAQMLGFARREDLPRELRALAARLDARAADTGEPLVPGDTPVQRALRGESVMQDVRVRHRVSGMQRVLRCAASPTRGAGGAVTGAVLVALDVTARRALEQQLQQTAEFRERLIGIVGHDLRNPLNAILLSAQMLAQHAEELPEPARRAATRIRTSGERMREMISQLLDFTRARLGSALELERREVALASVVREAVDELLAAQPGRRVELTVTGDTTGQFDAGRLAQVVSNLVGNALKYAPAQLPVHVHVEGADEDVLLAVHNGGAPIPPELLPVLFDPFRRGAGHAEGGGMGRGLGLGLFIVRQAVLAHGGAIDVTSSRDEGTTFIVTLPRQPPSS